MIDGQAAQVVLDSLPELGRLVVDQHSARLVPARANLADQGETLGVGIQRLSDELICDIGTVVLGSVDVIDAEFDGAAEYGNCGISVARRSEHPRTRKLHRAEPDARHSCRP